MNTLKDKLILLREAKGISQSQLAQKIGVSRSSISKYEKGERIPGRDILITLAKYYNVSSDYLLDAGNMKNLATPEQSDETVLLHQTFDAIVDSLDEDGVNSFREILSVMRKNPSDIKTVSDILKLVDANKNK